MTPIMTDEDVRRLVAQHQPPTLRQRIYRMRHHELLTELYLLDPVDPDRDGNVVDFRARLSRDKLIAGILDWSELFAIESVNCPGCWAAPKKACIICHPYSATVVGATEVPTRLPRMYHAERRERALHKVGLPV